MVKLVLLVIAVFAVCSAIEKNSGDSPPIEEKEMPEDFSALDQIFTVNQIDVNKDTYSTGIDEEMFEGDIVWTKELKTAIGEMRARASGGMSPFDAITNGAWPNGVVPYTFRRGFGYKQVVMQAIAEYNSKTCIRFKQYTAELAKKAGGYVEFMHGGGCYSMIGRQGGKQQISLGQGCGYKGVAIHEMMHALGFYHEQSRLDRDNYITINWNNINRRMWYNFQKYRPGEASTLGESYDKTSIMHYGNYAFSTNGRKTIVSKSNSNENLGQRNGLSNIDVNQLKKYYKCGSVRPVKPPTPSCKDHYEFCGDLKSKWCNNVFVKTNCKQSCGECSDCKGVEDIQSLKNCKYWKEQDFCKKKWVSYMKVNCKRTCGFC